jgi:putative hemolysin
MLFQNYTGPFSAHRQAIRSFLPKTKIFLEKGNFTVKTASTGAELEEVLKLRSSIFHREFMNKRFVLGLDTDRFDHLADHLVIIDKRHGKIVGTYRLISSRTSTSYYSQTEFSLESLLALPGTKLELSRACIQKEYRSGVVMNLLWRGISQVLREIGASQLFGCASIRTMNATEVNRIYQWLHAKGAISTELSIVPVADYRLPGFQANTTPLTESEEAVVKAMIPPLCHSYLKAGAKVCSQPALDRDFRCVDLLTVLNMDDLSRMHERKYVAC